VTFGMGRVILCEIERVREWDVSGASNDRRKLE